MLQKSKFSSIYGSQTGDVPVDPIVQIGYVYHHWPSFFFDFLFLLSDISCIFSPPAGSLISQKSGSEYQWPCHQPNDHGVFWVSGPPS